MPPKDKGTRVAIYCRRDIYDALKCYRAAGVDFNLSRHIQLGMVDKFMEIERARRAIGEPFLYTPERLLQMRKEAEGG